MPSRKKKSKTPRRVISSEEDADPVETIELPSEPEVVEERSSTPPVSSQSKSANKASATAGKPPLKKRRGTSAAGSAPGDQAGPSTSESGQGSTFSATSDEIPGLQLINERLIHLVEERPPLWDPEDRGHSNRELVKRKWIEIFKELCVSWDSLTPAQRRACKEKIVTRWCSIRDRFIRDCHKEEQQPSGSEGNGQRTCAHQGLLHFLRRTAGLRRTHSSTVEPEAAPDEAVHEEESVVPIVPHVSSQDTPPPLEDTAASGPTSRTRVAAQRPSASRSYQREIEDFKRLTYEALSKLEDKIDGYRLEDLQQRQLEGARPSLSYQSNYFFFQSLLVLMEDLTPEETHECRQRIQEIVFDILCRRSLATQTPSRPIAPPPTHLPAITAPPPTYPHAYAPPPTHLPAITAPPPTHLQAITAPPPTYPHAYAPPPAHSYPQPTSYAYSHSIAAPSPSLSTAQPTPTQTHALPPGASLTQPDSF